jgi:hypothetical protein
MDERSWYAAGRFERGRFGERAVADRIATIFWFVWVFVALFGCCGGFADTLFATDVPQKFGAPPRPVESTPNILSALVIWGYGLGPFLYRRREGLTYQRAPLWWACTALYCLVLSAFPTYLMVVGMADVDDALAVQLMAGVIAVAGVLWAFAALAGYAGSCDRRATRQDALDEIDHVRIAVLN